VHMCESPLSLRVSLPLKYWSRDVSFTIDSRVGQVISSLHPPCSVEGVASTLEEVGRTLTSSAEGLPSQLSLLQ